MPLGNHTWTLKQLVNAWGTPKKQEIRLIAVEHSLRLEADPFRAKLIAEAVREYLHKYYQLENNDTSLTDFLYNIEAEYQVINGLDEDNWDFTEADKKKLE